MSRSPYIAVLLLLAALLGGPGRTRADATVSVELKGAGGAPVDGTVDLTQGEKRHRCTTTGGKCELHGVAGGMYRVEVHVPGRSAPKPRQAMIPSTGLAKLVVSAV